MASSPPRPPLPRELGRYRLRWREPTDEEKRARRERDREAQDAAASELGFREPKRAGETDDAMLARDPALGREFLLERVVFGREKLAERDAFIRAMHERTTWLEPSLLAVHDAGVWDDDAFVLLEHEEGWEPLTRALREPNGDLETSAWQRVRWADALLCAARFLESHGAALDEAAWSRTTFDRFGLLRIPGLAHAAPRDAARDASTRAALRRWLDALPANVDAADPDAPRITSELDALASSLTDDADLAALHTRLEALLASAARTERPLVSDIDAESLQAQRRLVAYVGLSIFLAAFAVMVVALLLAHR